MIRKAAAGIYTYLPLGWRSIMKMMDIVRREMNAAGAVELMMPAIHPAELWKENGSVGCIRRSAAEDEGPQPTGLLLRPDA